MPNGKQFRDLRSRAQHVNRLNEELFNQPSNITSTANKLSNELLTKTNAQVHPTIPGNETLFSPDTIIFLTAHYAFFTLLAYKNGVDDHREFLGHSTRGERLFLYPPGNKHLIQLGKQIHDVYLRMSVAIMEQTERGGQARRVR